MWLSIFIAVWLYLAGIVHSAPTDSCSKLPSWSFSGVVKSGRDAVGTSGTASLKFTNDQNGKTDKLTCSSLLAGYRCEFKGTPTDKDLHITLQFQMEVLYVYIEGDITCDGASKHFGGQGAIDLTCTSARIGGEVSCTSSDTDIGHVTAVLV